MKKKIICTVTNDLAYDQRMQRICRSLSKDYDVELVGRKLSDAILPQQDFFQTRLYCFFNRGKFFYAEFNIRLFFYLLLSKADIICSIDLDTILPGVIVSRIKGVPCVYDAHEYYTEVIELVNRPAERKIWEWIASFCIPRVKAAYTVSATLQKIFTERYGIPFGLVRNIAELKPKPKKEHGKPYLIYAGAVNEGRGVREILHALQYISMPLLICGTGDVLEEMKALTTQLELDHQVTFMGNVPPAQLDGLISNAFAGFLLLENKGLSYYYSLANKFFDYIHGEIPQITISFPEYQLLNAEHEVAILIDLEENQIIEAVQRLTLDNELYDKLVNNCKMAKHRYNWQTESETLLTLYKRIS